jgi:hypothetical protein
MMKRPSLSDGNERFAGSLRHYHRSGASSQRSWDEWIDGDQAKIRGSKSGWKVLATVVGALALAAVIIALLVGPA